MEMESELILDSIESWCKTHKEILFLEKEIRVAEAEHDLFLHHVWGPGPRCCVHAEQARRAKIAATKKRVQDLKAMNDISNGGWLLQIARDAKAEETKGKIARWALVKMIRKSSQQAPKSFCLPNLPLEDYEN
jgi:hypothetical protein